MEKYGDIINLPHHISRKRPRMSMCDRAAQFSPFAALTGHEEAIEETARLTENRVEIDEKKKSILNDKLKIIEERMKERPIVTVTYFLQDERKAGGAYITAEGFIKRLDNVSGNVTMGDGKTVYVENIIELEGEVFKEYFSDDIC